MAATGSAMSAVGSTRRLHAVAGSARRSWGGGHRGKRERGGIEESMPLPDPLARVGEEVARDERERERWVGAWGVDSHARGRSCMRAAVHWPLKMDGRI